MPSSPNFAHSLPRKALLAAAIQCVLLLGFLLPASAKGPESVTISGPGIEQPLELIDADNFELLVTLMEQTGLWYGTGDPIGRPTGELGPAHTLTWINGGPPALPPKERMITQLLYLDAQGGPLIHTPDQKNLENWGPGVTGWFAAPEGLRDTLEGLGVPGMVKTPPQVTSPSERVTGAVRAGSESAGIKYLAVVGLALMVVSAGVLGARYLIRLRG